MGGKNLRRQALEGVGIGLAVGLAVCLLVGLGVFEPLERQWVDGLLRATAEPERASDQIVLVAMDQGSVEHVENTLAMPYPWPRAFYAAIVDFIERGQPRGVVFDILFTGEDIDRDEILGAESDRLLAAAVERAERVVLGVSLRPADPTPQARLSTALIERMASGLQPPQRLDRFARVDPLARALLDTRAAFGFVNAAVDEDGIVRRAQLLARVDGAVVPSLTLAALLDGRAAGAVRCDDRGLWLGERLIRLDDRGRAWIRFHGPGGPGREGQGRSYRYLPIANLLRSAEQLQHGMEPLVDPGLFRDKWVIIGSTSPALFDQKATPFSPEGNYPGMEIHATVLDNMLHGGFLWRAPRWLVWALVVLAAVLVGLIGRLTLQIRWNVLASLGLAAGLLALSMAVFAGSGLIVDAIAVQVAVGLSFVVVTYANYARERAGRRRIRNIFQHYLDPRIVRGLIETPERVALGGERRVCTVFFSDIVGFTSLAEGMQPEQLVELMNGYLGSMTEVIIRRGGFVDKYIGDAVMAVFGAPADLPGHERAACQAALDCHRRLAAFDTAFAEQGWPALRIRVGLNSGEMIVGNMGSEKRMNYTVMGDAVNLASRLEGANKEFGTASIVGPDTRAAAGEELVFRELDLLRVKGKLQPVCIYELVGEAERVSGDTGQRLELFERGLQVYRRRRWQEAHDLFEQLLVRWPDDGPARTYLERCKAFIAAPPPADWDGVFVMTSK